MKYYVVTYWPESDRYMWSGPMKDKPAALAAIATTKKEWLESVARGLVVVAYATMRDDLAGWQPKGWPTGLKIAA